MRAARGERAGPPPTTPSSPPPLVLSSSSSSPPLLLLSSSFSSCSCCCLPACPPTSDSDSQSSVTQQSLSDGEDHLERLQQVELTRSVPISLWKAATVHTWLALVMAMPMYTRACSDTVKSGKVSACVSVCV